MTGRELLNELQKLPDEELDRPVLVADKQYNMNPIIEKTVKLREFAKFEGRGGNRRQTGTYPVIAIG